MINNIFKFSVVIGVQSCIFSAYAQMAQNPEMLTIESVANTIEGTGIPLSQVPSNAQTLNVKSIADEGTTDLGNLLNANLGSVSVSNGTGNPYQNDINYRGFQSTSLLGAPVGLSVYFDGIRMNQPFGSIVNWDQIPINAISGIDVLPGSNPMFGLNTLGGALVVNTKNGKDNAGTSLSVIGGSFGRKGFQAESGWVDAEHDTDYFISANIDNQDGYRNYSSSSVQQYFGKVRWHSSVDSLALSMAYTNSTLNGTQSLPMDMMSDPKSAYTWPDSIANESYMVNLKGSHWLNDLNQVVGNVYYVKSNATSQNSNAALDDGCYDSNNNVTTKCANAAPNGTAVNNVTGARALALGYGRWTSSINSSLVDSSTQQKSVGGGLQWSNFDQLMNFKNSFTLGGSFDYSQSTYNQNTYLARLINYQAVLIPQQAYGFTSNGLVPSASNPLSFSASNVLSGVNLNANQTSVSTYFTNNIELTDKFNVTASGSYNFTRLNQAGQNNQYLNDDGGNTWQDGISGVNYYNPSYLGAYKYSNSGSGYGSAITPPAGYIAGPQTSSLSGNDVYQRFNPALGFNYNPDKSIGFFGGYSEAMRAPTSIELSCADPNHPCTLPTGFNGDPPLKAVVARTFELGARGNLSKTSAWNMAVYNTALQNDIQFIAATSTTGYFNNVGTTQRRGFELGISDTFDKLFLSANYGYVDAIYKSSFTTSTGGNVVSGNHIPGIAAQGFKGRAIYNVTPDLMLGSTLILNSSQWAHGNEDNSNPNGKVAGYGLVNLDIHYKVTENVRLFGLVNNLFNNQYSTYGLSGMTSVYTLTTQNFLTPAPPRSIWVGATYSFNGN